MSEFDCSVTDLDEKCAECKYADKSAFSEPCVECGFNYSRFEQKQEAVEPTFKQDNDGIFVWACGSCGAYMYHIYEGIDKAKEYAKYCRQCGRKVKWDG